jgi:hypothetical protein
LWVSARITKLIIMSGSAHTRTIGDAAATEGVGPHLICSPEPSVVFGSLASLSVPGFSDYCGVFIEEAGGSPYLIERPAPGAGPSGRRILSTPILIPAACGRDWYQGVVEHWWRDPARPSLPDAIAAMEMVDLAVRVVRNARGLLLRSGSGS